MLHVPAVFALLGGGLLLGGQLVRELHIGIVDALAGAERIEADLDLAGPVPAETLGHVDHVEAGLVDLDGGLLVVGLLADQLDGPAVRDGGDAHHEERGLRHIDGEGLAGRHPVWRLLPRDETELPCGGRERAGRVLEPPPVALGEIIGDLRASEAGHQQNQGKEPLHGRHLRGKGDGANVVREGRSRQRTWPRPTSPTGPTAGHCGYRLPPDRRWAWCR